MGVSIKLVAQSTMDLFIGNFRSETDFFDLNDFITNCGATLGEFYRQEFLSKYGELRQEKKDELVSFDPEILNEATLKVEKKDGGWFAEMTEPVFSFPYDQQSCGYQIVYATKPRGACEFERTNASSVWMQKHYPFVNKAFWWPERRKIRFFSNSGSNVAEIKVLYVPAIGPEMMVPDALVDMVKNTTVGNMRQLLSGNIVKQTNDLNSNRIMQTEINKQAL